MTDLIPTEVWLALAAVVALTGYALFGWELHWRRHYESEAKRHQANWDRALASNVRLGERLRNLETLLPQNKE